jgi:hypothetical protein
MRSTLLLLTEALLLSLTTALHIGDASPCYSACNGDDLTVTSDLSCLDQAYDTSIGTSQGKIMRTCLECTEKSTYSNASDSETDQYWFMFHLKYTQQFCLFDESAAVDACGTQCAPLEPVLTFLWANTDPPLRLYEYCSQTSDVYPEYAPDCAACLKNRTGTVVLGNCKFMSFPCV